MLRLRKLYEDIRRLERGGKEQRRIPKARFVVAILVLIGLETLLVLWLYELPARPASFGRASGLLEPSILLTHPKGPVPATRVGRCSDRGGVPRSEELTRKQKEEAEQHVIELQRSMNHAYILAGFSAAMALFFGWGG